LQRLTMVAETHHGCRDSPWLQRLTTVAETHHGCGVVSIFVLPLTTILVIGGM